MAVATMDSLASHADVDDSLITTRLWIEGERPRVVSLNEAERGDGIVHFDVHFGAEPQLVYDALRPTCGPDLTIEMVRDLLTPDELPKVTEHDSDGKIRAVSAFAVKAIGPGADSNVCSGRLAFDLVEFLANDHWLVSCSHMAKSYAGRSGVEEREPGHACGQMLREVSRRWRETRGRTAGDLGVLFLHELTCSYSNAWRAMFTWLDRWERLFYDDPKLEQDTLKDLRGLSSEFRSRLNALNVPRDEAGSAWFGGVTDDTLAERADRHIDRALSSLDRLGDMLRSSFALLQANAAMEQQKESGEFQHKFELVTAVFLVPTLIAGTWGENTWVPGEGKAWGFGVTILTMIAGALLALAWLRRRDRKAKS